MWPLALYQLLEAEDCRAYIDQRLEGVDYLAVPVGPGSYGEWFLEDVVSGADHGWAGRWVPPEQADCVLAALGLLHMRFEVCYTGGLGGNYVPEVSGMLIALYFMGCTDLRCCAVNLQMLWWGTDETLAESFMRHESVENFKGNWMSSFRATFEGVEYGPDKTPV